MKKLMPLIIPFDLTNYSIHEIVYICFKFYGICRWSITTGERCRLNSIRFRFDEVLLCVVLKMFLN